MFRFIGQRPQMHHSLREDKKSQQWRASHKTARHCQDRGRNQPMETQGPRRVMRERDRNDPVNEPVVKVIKRPVRARYPVIQRMALQVSPDRNHETPLIVIRRELAESETEGINGSDGQENERPKCQEPPWQLRQERVT